MIAPVAYVDLPDGSYALLHDPRDEDWSMLQKLAPSVDQFLVSWRGVVLGDSHDPDTFTWSAGILRRIKIYPIDPGRADAIIMWCLHTKPDPDKWYAYAEHQVTR